MRNRLAFAAMVAVWVAACDASESSPSGTPLAPPPSDNGDAAPVAVPDAGGADTGAPPADKDAAPPGPAFRDRCVPDKAPTPPPPLRTFYVDGDKGNDANDGASPATAWKTLTKANASARAGDLFLLSGTFDGQYIRPAASGTADHMIVFRGPARIQNAQYGTAVSLSGIDYVAVDGLEITKNGDPASLGNHDWLQNGKIHDNAGYIRIIGVQSSRVEDNDITGCGEYCFWTSEGATANAVLRNKIGDAKSTAFMLFSSGNTIGFNDFANTLQTNLAVQPGADQTVIECNTFRLAGTAAASGYYTPSALVSSNKNLIRYNLVYGNLLEGISFWGESNANDVYHNVSWGNGGPGIRILVDLTGKDIRDNHFKNNVFWNDNSNGDSHWNYNGTKGKVVVDTYHVQTNGWSDGSFGGNTLENNLLGMNATETGKPWLLMIGYTSERSYTLADATAKWPDALKNDFEADPMFFAPETGAFQLKEGSPCIDKGVAIPGLEFVGAAPDIGRYEYLGPAK
jgi:Right handed beta helix region